MGRGKKIDSNIKCLCSKWIGDIVFGGFAICPIHDKKIYDEKLLQRTVNTTNGRTITATNPPDLGRGLG